MARTQIPSSQIGDEGIKRVDLNVSETGSAVITKVIAGNGISITSTGVDAGTGDVTIKSVLAGEIGTKTANYTVVNGDFAIMCNATGGAFTVTLPTAVGIAGKIFVIKKIDGSLNAVTVATTSSQTIDGVTTRSLAIQYNAIMVVSDNGNWFII